MPLYQQIIVALPKVSKETLVTLTRKHCKLILDTGGNVRGVENHGIRQLPERARRFVF
jgi:ribosomal protein S6